MNTAALVAADHAIVVVGRLRESWEWLGDATEPGRARRTERHLSDASRNRLRRLGLAERADRIQIMRSGSIPSGTTAAPVRIGALDAREQIREHLDTIAWEVASHTRTRPGTHYRPNGATADTAVTAALNYLGTSLHNVDDVNLVASVHNRLQAADTLARTASGAGDIRQSLHAACPSCGRRSLVSETGSSDYREWAVLCTRQDCRCQGHACPCRMIRRYPGAHHVWLERYWVPLAALLTAQEGKAA